MFNFIKQFFQDASISDFEHKQIKTITNESFNNEVFKKFIDLRDKFRNAKRNKNYELIIEHGQAIINLEPQAKFLSIHISGFQEDMADAFSKLGNIDMARSLYLSAKNGLEDLRKSGRIAKQDDWLDNIALINRKLSKLQCDS